MHKIIEKALGFLAKIVIRKYHPFIIGITGSVGKTSAKEAIALVLKKEKSLRVSPQNYNNELGVPLTIIDSRTQGKNLFGWLSVFCKVFLEIILPLKFPKVLVLEMAADKPGDIKHLIKMAPCQIGVITAITPVHLEKFKNIENILKEKQLIATHLLPNGWAILNGDDEKLREIKNKIRAKILTFGFSDKNDIQALEVSLSQKITEKGDLKIDGLRFKLSYRGKIIPVVLPGIIAKHQIYSVLAAISVGVAMDLNILDVVENLKEFSSPKGRMKIVAGIKNSLIIDDSYNSSPKAVDLAMETLSEISVLPGRRKIVALGDMLELGSFAEEAHRQIGKIVNDKKISLLVTVGSLSKKIAEEAIKNGFPNEWVFEFEDSLSAGKFLKEKINYGDVILVKGSQSIRMEKIVKEIMAEPDRAQELLVRQGREWE